MKHVRFIVCVFVAATALAFVTDCALGIWLAATDTTEYYDPHKDRKRSESGHLTDVYIEYKGMIYAVFEVGAIGVIAWHFRK